MLGFIVMVAAREIEAILKLNWTNLNECPFRL